MAAALVLTACSAGAAAHRSFRPEVVTASGVPYTGNSIAAVDPQAALTKAIRATSSASTVHVTGALTGVPVPAPTVSQYSSVGTGAAAGLKAGQFSLDMVFTQFGAVGDLTAGSVTTRLLRVEDEVWTAEPASFWKAAGAVDGGKAYGGLYVKIPAADPGYTGFADDTRVGYLLDRLLQTSESWKRGPLGVVGGVPALELDCAGTGGHQTAVWVATGGEPYLLKVAPSAGGYHGEIDFTGYDRRLAVQAPVPGQVLDDALLVLPAPPSTTSAALTGTSVYVAGGSPSASSTSESPAPGGGKPSHSASPTPTPTSPSTSNSGSATASSSPSP